MAYTDDIDSLSPDHHWAFDGDSTDSIGSVIATDTSILYTGTAICEDATNCAQTNAISDRVSIASVATINNSAQSRKAVGGWFVATGIQNPPKNIYGEGNDSQAFRFILGWGNNLMFEVDDPNFTIQVFGDTVLEVNRPYHLLLLFSGSGYSNEVSAYLDGVRQLNAEPVDRQPGAATLTARTVGEFGDPAGTVGVGGTAVILLAPINGKYNHWAAWDGINAGLTDSDVRITLFEKGALPDNTITNQSGLDALADTIRPNAPCCIRVTGDGTINLTADNVTFNPLASIHVQYTGTGTLNWTNSNGSDASIGSTTNGGSINFINPATFTINGLIDGAEVRIYDTSNVELDGIETNTGTSFAYAHSGATLAIVVQMIADGYEEIWQDFTLNSTDQILVVFPKVDGNI